MRSLVVLLPLLFGACAAPATRCAGLAGEHMLQAELFFGRSSPGGPIGEPAWRGFLAEVVTPRFPDGFTVLDGYGQWRQRATGRIGSELSTELLVVAPDSPTTLASLEAIRAEYKRRFAQESVGLAVLPVCADF